MFAITEIVYNKLYALKEADGSDVFQNCFNNWQDTLWLHTFFKENPHALRYYGVDQKTAIQQIIKESETFSDDILNIAEGNTNASSLDDIVFQPLHKNDDFSLSIVESKAYGSITGKSFLRLYAVRLKDGAFIVVGGLIKSTQTLQEYEEGKQILEKLRKFTEFLRTGKYFDSFDIGVLII